MELQFKNNKLEKLCSSEREMQRKRPDLKKKLRLRMNALRAADTIGDLPTDDPGGDWHDVDSMRPGCWAGELSGNWRLLVKPSPAGKLSAKVATVFDIEDYHKN